mmetsp:Transcript_32214/g.78882  ORF Transcript_32214/g.78882 Transcript_32214/m.78882 type:complete len:238 (-) Transcript_32214:119-832(-)
MQDRRPIASRDTRLAHAAARTLAGMGVTANAISIASVVLAVMGAVVLVTAVNFIGDTWRCNVALVLFAASVQLRLVCNLLDGMVAIEYGGGPSVLGGIYNDFPDRISDVLFIAAFGFFARAAATAAPHAALLHADHVERCAWVAAVLAVITAYVRCLGAACGTHHVFEGVMAKAQRMAVLTVAALLTCAEGAVARTWCRVPTVALLALVAGTAHTIYHRVVVIARLMHENARGAKAQ